MRVSPKTLRRPGLQRSWAAFFWLILALPAFACAAPHNEIAANTPASTPSFLLFKSTPESRVTISGRASIGSWECDTTDIQATITPGPQLVEFALGKRPALANTPNNIAPPAARIALPVNSLRCDKPGMRADLLRALRHKTSPLILFQLSSVEHLERAPSPGDWPAYRVTVSGELKLAGETRPIRIVADVRQETPVSFRVLARETLRMSDFSIKPPTAFFGLIQADNTVEIAFDLRFSLSGAAAD
jgi:hypothetical protein